LIIIYVLPVEPLYDVLLKIW